MAILAAVALTAVGEMVPAKSRTAAVICLFALTAAPALWVSGKLVFVAMRTSPEIRVLQYQVGVMRAVRPRIDYVQGLTNDDQLDAMFQLAKAPKTDCLMRLVDYNDSFTRKNLEEVKRRTNWREVGYFPSLFEGMDVNTLIAYHSWAYRYMFLPAAPPSR
jgi:hypothetical protein